MRKFILRDRDEQLENKVSAMNRLKCILVVVILLSSITALMPSVLADDTTFNFLSQIPNDLNSFNIIGNPMNITYEITDPAGINDSTVEIHFKNNKTGSDIDYYVNGTPVGGYRAESFSSKSGSNYSFLLRDNQVYPATYNFDEETLEHTVHSSSTLANQNSYLSVQFLNVSKSMNYSFFEIMVNNTGSTGIRIYYANSSYNFASDPSTNSNCVLLYTIPGNTPYNHTHPLYSKHQYVPMAINKTTGRIGTVTVTSTSYFIVRGNAGSVTNHPEYYYISNVSRSNATRRSTNSGSSWSNQALTVDAHLHQYNGTDYLYYYISAKNTLDVQSNSTVRPDLIDLGGLAPTVTINSPAATSYSGVINITYAAESPNSYPIVNYSISLYNSSYGLVTSINPNTANNYVQWNSTIVPDGEYLVEIMAYDSLGQKGYGNSEFFNAFGGTGPTAIVTCDVHPKATASIICNRTTWTPYCGVGYTEATATDWALIQNDGTVHVFITVIATNTSAWILEDAPAHNKFQMQVAKNLEDWSDITTTSELFISDLAYGSSQAFGLKVFMPISTSTNTNQTTIITFQATVL